ncbi:proline-rich transmembrane protein 4 isoform X2 [Esox lucius]|uniref:proline-rich transmembrane protein 4 isoform X2 n=1 Tax=Esox lucius TaxID=8010 RepID=UPI001476F1E5|nr:proline-rich transmembrane protein 4 isoform X2 [Esox lucius]
MFRLSPDFCFWCFVLAIVLHTTTFADEEADLTQIGQPKPTKLPDSKGSFFWRPSWSIDPSNLLPSLNLFGKKSDTKDVGPLRATGIPTTGPSPEPSKVKPSTGSGEENLPRSPQTSTTISSTDNPPSSTEIRTVANPHTDIPNKSTQPNNKDILYSTTSALESISSISMSKGIKLSSPTSTNTPPLTTTQSHLLPETSQMAVHSRRITSKPFPEKAKTLDELLAPSVPLLTAPQTPVLTTLVKTPPRNTVSPTPVEATLTRQPFNSESPPRSPHTRVPTTGLDPTVSTHNITQTQPRPPDLGFSEAKVGPTAEQPETNTPTRRKDGAVPRAASTTLELLTVYSTAPRVVPDEKGEGTGMYPGERDVDVVTVTAFTPLNQGSEPTYLPDCNQERSGICSVTDTWEPPTANGNPTPNTTDESNSPFAVPAQHVFIPLHSDWNSAMASWGLAWEAHIYGLGSIFALVTLASALNLLCLPLRCPSGCGYFSLVSVFLLAAACTRAFSLLYDAYGHQDRLPSTEASLLLYEAPFPCLTAAFGLVFLLLSMRSRMQLSYSAFQRPCFLACLVLLHFAAAFGPIALLRLYQQRAPLSLFLSLVSRGAFVALASFLSAAYFVFFCYVRADSKHIYHLNNTSPTPAERFNRCPFAENRDWDRAAAAVCLSALFSLACAGLQLYAMLHAMGLAGGADVFRPWPWWTFQLSCRLCEAGMCLTLALVVAQPIYCSDHLPQPGSCWTELLAVKSPIMPGTYQWTLNQQEKLAICDNIGHGETECLPLYTLVDERLGTSLNGLDLLYHSNRALAYRDLDLDLPDTKKPEEQLGGEASGGSSFTSDSTADLRPPSPINLRRSIDEALFSEELFPISLFSPAVPFHCSDLSLNSPYSTSIHHNGGQALQGTLSADPGLYRTSSCVELAPQHPPPLPNRPLPGAPLSPPLSSNSSCSSPERWRNSSSSCSLYRPSQGVSSSPEAHAQPHSLCDSTASGHQGSHLQRRYRTLGSASQESLDLESEADRSVQEEFINVCRQIDSMSICSETIDL